MCFSPIRLDPRVKIKSPKNNSTRGSNTLLTLHSTALQCNPNVQISGDGGQLTNDAGMVLILEFLHRLHFDSLLTKCVHFDDHRKFHTAAYHDIFRQKLLLDIAGYLHDDAADSWLLDPAMQAILGQDKLVSQPSLSRFFGAMTANNLDELRQLLWKTATLSFQHSHQSQFVLDIDSTHADTFGEQESSAYNAHYMAKGYHPQVLFDCQSRMLLDLWSDLATFIPVKTPINSSKQPLIGFKHSRTVRT